VLAAGVLEAGAGGGGIAIDGAAGAVLGATTELG
jgi:hypothetical protein